MHPDPDMHRALLAAARVTVTEPVRGYEMGQDACLPYSGFARYFEHMRWELGRRGHVRDEQMPKRGVVRAQTHEYLGALRFPATWTGRTHLIQVGGSSVHYGHDIAGSDGSVVVRARTTIVLLGSDGRPARAPEYLRSYADSDFDAPAPLPATEALGTVTSAYSLRVRHSDQDSFGHANQARYVDFLDDARRAARLPPIRRVSLAYERETLAGDELVIHLGEAQAVAPESSTGGASPSTPRARYAFEMTRVADGVCVNRGAFEV